MLVTNDSAPNHTHLMYFVDSDNKHEHQEQQNQPHVFSFVFSYFLSLFTTPKILLVCGFLFTYPE